MGRRKLGNGETVALLVKMPAELVERIDAAAEGNRSAWIRAVAVDALEALDASYTGAENAEAVCGVSAQEAWRQLDIEEEARKRRKA